MSLKICFFTVAAVCLLAAAPVVAQVPPAEQIRAPQRQDMHAPPPVHVAADLPASMTTPSGVLSLAPQGIQLLPGLPVHGQGCAVCPSIRCTGPLYPLCAPSIYYGTNPRDDDPVHAMYPQINDHRTLHWYDAAKRMVLRKKAITEAIR